MAGLYVSYATRIQSLAWTLVLSFLVRHCLASLPQLQPVAMSGLASATQWGDGTATSNKQPPLQLTSLRHILKRSAATGGVSSTAALNAAKDSARTSVELNLAHNLTDVNTLLRNPSDAAAATAEQRRMQYNIQNTAPERTDVESSGAKEDYASVVLPDTSQEVNENEFLKVNTLDETQDPSVERTKSQSSTTQMPDNVICPGCIKQQQQRKKSQLDSEALRHIRIETIKMQILSKLRFEKPPNVTKGEINIPAPLSEGQFGGGEEELIDFTADNELGEKNSYYAKTTQVIITAKDGKYKIQVNKK